MKLRISFAAIAALTAPMLMQAELRAQDIPGIEICTVEKTMERRTSCLQSNVEFLEDGHKARVRLSVEARCRKPPDRSVENCRRLVAENDRRSPDVAEADDRRLEEESRCFAGKGRRADETRQVATGLRYDARNCSSTALSGS